MHTMTKKYLQNTIYCRRYRSSLKACFDFSRLWYELPAFQELPLSIDSMVTALISRLINSALFSAEERLNFWSFSFTYRVTVKSDKFFAFIFFYLFYIGFLSALSHNHLFFGNKFIHKICFYISMHGYSIFISTS